MRGHVHAKTLTMDYQKLSGIGSLVGLVVMVPAFVGIW